MAARLVTERLVLRGWAVDDAGAALGAYGDRQVARWLAPEMDQVPDLAAMRLVLQQWTAEDARMLPPAGRWAAELRAGGQVIGGATLLPLPPDEEFEMGWQLRTEAWGHGYATEIGRALALWAFGQGIEQVIALVRPANTRAAATARRIGMEWAGETEKYHGLRLQEFLLRPGDLRPDGTAVTEPEQVTDNEAEARLELRAGGQLAELLYRRRGDRLVLLHTEVPAALEGHGIGGKLVTAAIDRAARQGLTVVPLCPFARAWLERHPEAAERAVIDWSQGG
jgi:RimJ/RimL family protein N-acetyltransferase/predicted GNAT family acetyltransferase